MNRLVFSFLGLIVCLFACGIVELAQGKPAATFTGIGRISGADSSHAHGISADGSVVIGYGTGGTLSSERALMWSPRTGIVDLGFPEGFGSSEAWATSANGDVIVGTAREGYGFRWTPSNGMAIFNDSMNLRPMAISDDGTTIAGGGTYDTVGGWFQAFRWKNATGIVSLGALGGFGDSSVLDVSADGSVLVGSSRNYGPEQAFRWTEASGMKALSQDPSSATAVSADGKVIVGRVAFGLNSTPRAAFRWTQQSGLTLLEPPTDDFDWQDALAVSSDGSRIVGSTNFAASIWEESLGMLNLRNLLVDRYGLDSTLQGWNLTEATGISADGRVITGNGINSQGNWEAWVVTLPVPEPNILLLAAVAFLAFTPTLRVIGTRHPIS